MKPAPIDPGICQRCGLTLGLTPSHRAQGVCPDGHTRGRYPRRHRGRHRFVLGPHGAGPM